MSFKSAATLVIAGLLLAAGLSGCNEDVPTSEPAAEVRPAPAPPVGACYRLDLAAGLELASSAPRVACSRRHTSVTVAVGRVKRNKEGRLLPIRSPGVQRQIADTCKAKVDAHVGGSTETRRLSRVQAVWFTAQPTDLAAGARWFRCDLVIAGNRADFAALPPRTTNLLRTSKVLDKYGTCGTAAPGKASFRRVACSAPHTWRARASIDLPPGAQYLGKNAAKVADSRCRDIEARRAVRVTELRWSFEWPTKAQWNSGQRYGLCWTRA